MTVKLTTVLSFHMEQLANPVPCVIVMKKHCNVYLRLWEAGT